MDPALERLLEEDPMGKLFKAATAASQPFTNYLMQEYPRLTRSLKEARESSTPLDFSSEEGVRASATTLRATYEELQGYLELRCFSSRRCSGSRPVSDAVVPRPPLHRVLECQLVLLVQAGDSDFRPLEPVFRPLPAVLLRRSRFCG